MKISSRITDLETVLLIFEAKLNSVHLDENEAMKVKVIEGEVLVESVSDDYNINGKAIFNESNNNNKNKNNDKNESNKESQHVSNYDSATLFSTTHFEPPSYPPPPPPTTPTPPPLSLPPPPPPPPFIAPSIPIAPSTATSTQQQDISTTLSHSQPIEIEVIENNQNSTSSEGKIKVKDHPDYIVYFKMMKVIDCQLDYLSLFISLRSVYNFFCLFFMRARFPYIFALFLILFSFIFYNVF